MHDVSFLCLFVCEQYYGKTPRRISTKLGGGIRYGPRIMPLDFGLGPKSNMAVPRRDAGRHAARPGAQGTDPSADNTDIRKTRHTFKHRAEYGNFPHRSLKTES